MGVNPANKFGPRLPTSLSGIPVIDLIKGGNAILDGIPHLRIMLTTEERIAIMREFDEPGMLTAMGLYLGGTKYVVTRVEPGDVMRAKKPGESVTIKKTSAALVIGIYYISATSNMCNAIVERVGDDLIKRGY